MSRWFRFYDTVLDDPKVQRLADHLFRGWVNILCLASKHGGKLPSIPDIAFCLRIPDDQADSLVQSLLDARLLEDNGEFLTPHNWSERQYVDSTNAIRQQRFREKKRSNNQPVTESNGVTNVKITPLDTDTDTDTETDTEKKKTKHSRSPKLAEFEQFWSEYPRKTAKGGAEKAWLKAIGQTDAETILAGLRSAKFSSDPQYVPHPATWLNQRRWEDGPQARKLTLAEQYAMDSFGDDQDLIGFDGGNNG
jgi:hypothetical protein